MTQQLESHTSLKQQYKPEDWETITSKMLKENYCHSGILCHAKTSFKNEDYV